MSNINALVIHSLIEGRTAKMTKKDIMSDEEMQKLLQPECVQKGQEFQCTDLGFDKEADGYLKSHKR